MRREEVRNIKEAKLRNLEYKSSILAGLGVGELNKDFKREKSNRRKMLLWREGKIGNCTNLIHRGLVMKEDSGSIYMITLNTHTYINIYIYFH